MMIAGCDEPAQEAVVPIGAGRSSLLPPVPRGDARKMQVGFVRPTACVGRRRLIWGPPFKT
jgi:hypothetical protein